MYDETGNIKHKDLFYESVCDYKLINPTDVKMPLYILSTVQNKP